MKSRALTVGALLLASAGAHAHARSQGTSSFVVDEGGHVAISISMGVLDAVELCGADLTLSNAAPEEARMSSCLERNLPRWIVLHADGHACTTGAGAWHREGTADVVIEGAAACDHVPDKLMIDWGLFQGTGLDHVSLARVVSPDGYAQQGLLSKRTSKITASLARPMGTWVYVVVAAVIVVFLVAAWGTRRVLRRRRPSSPGSE